MGGICVEMCSSDQDCGGRERCCSNGCGHTCQQVAQYQMGRSSFSGSICFWNYYNHGIMVGMIETGKVVVLVF